MVMGKIVFLDLSGTDLAYILYDALPVPQSFVPLVVWHLI